MAIDRTLVGVGLLWLIAGTIFGVYLGLSMNNKFLDVHVAMLLTGFVMLTLYGGIYRLWPELKTAGLAKAQFWIALFGSVGMVAGAIQLDMSGGMAITFAVIGSTVTILGAILMAWLFWTKAEA